MEFVYISLQLECRECKMANMQIWTILWRSILPVINLVRDALAFNMTCIDTERLEWYFFSFNSAHNLWTQKYQAEASDVLVRTWSIHQLAKVSFEISPNSHFPHRNETIRKPKAFVSSRCGANHWHCLWCTDFRCVPSILNNTATMQT